MQKIIVFLSAFIFSISYADTSVLVYDATQRNIVQQKNVYEVRPIASITKLMTAIVALDQYHPDDSLHVNKKSTEKTRNLITRLLVRSDNNAAEILAKNYPGGRSAFIDAMNQKATMLNLIDTHFADPSGISADNVSTAVDVAVMVLKANEYPLVRAVSDLPEINKIINTKKGQKSVTDYYNTNKTILEEFKNIILSKTGFTSKAGRCVTMLVQKDDQKQVIVILGEITKQSRDELSRQLLEQYLL